MGIMARFRRVADAAILGALGALVTKHARAMTTGELASAPGVSMSRQGLLPRLERLEAGGALRRVPHADGSLSGWVPAEVSIPLPPPPPARKVAAEAITTACDAVRRLVTDGVATCAAIADALGWSRAWARAVVGAAVALGRLFRGGARNAELYPAAEPAVEATAAVAARRGFGATAKDAARWLLGRAQAAMPALTLAGFVQLVAKASVTGRRPFGSLLDGRAVAANGGCQ